MMKSEKISWLALIIGILALAASITCFYSGKKHNRCAFIVLKQVFVEFDMAKQYKKKMESVILARKGITDSLEFSLNAEARSLKAQATKSKDKMDQFEFDKEYFLEKRKQFQEDNQAMEKKYNEEVINQMNQYVKDYGEKNDFDFVYGAEGSGVLMFANKKLDITEEVIKYVNERYKGSSK